MSTRRALRSATGDAYLQSPLKVEPRKRSSRKKTPAVNDALASSVEAALEGQTPPSIQSEAESDMQATAESRSTSPNTTSQPMRRRLRSASRELEPDMTTAAPPISTKGASARSSSSSASKPRASQSTRGGSSRGRGRGKKTAPSSRKKGKRPASEISDHSADEADNDSMSRSSKRARSEQYSGDDDRTSIASTEADEHDSSLYHTPQAERALQPFSPIPEAEEPETPMGAVGTTSRLNQQQYVAESSRESITMSTAKGSLDVIEHTQQVIGQSSMELMQSTETNQDGTHDAEDMDMSDAQALSDSSDLADSPSAQLVPQSAENEQQTTDDSEEEESSDTSSEPEVSGSTTTIVVDPSASAANDQTASPNAGSVAQAQPNTPTSSVSPRAATSSWFSSKFNIFASAKKLAQPERAQSEGAQSPVLNSAPRAAAVTTTPQRPTNPAPSRAPATVARSTFDYTWLADRGIGPGQFNKRLAAYNPLQPAQPIQQEVEVEVEEDDEEYYTRRYDERQEEVRQPGLFSDKAEIGLVMKSHQQFKHIEAFKKGKKQDSQTIRKLKRDNEQMAQSMTLKSKQMFFPATSTRPERVLTDIAEIEELREVIEDHLSRKAEQQIGSASNTSNIELLAKKTSPAHTTRGTTAAVTTIDPATNPSHPASNSPAEVPVGNSAVNLPATDQRVITNASTINDSVVDENMEVDDAVDVAPPLTPTPATEPPRRSYWSAATSKIKSFASPFIFGQGHTAANAAPANNTETGTPQFTLEQSIDLGDTPTKPPNKRKTRPAGRPKQVTTFTSQHKRPEPKRRVPSSQTPSKNAGASSSRLQNESPKKLPTLEEAEEAEKARLAKVRERLDNMTPEEKVAHELKTAELETNMRERKERHEAYIAKSNARKRGSGLAFGDDAESASPSPKKFSIKRNPGQFKFPSLDEEQELNALVDEETAAAAAKAKTLAKGKAPMNYTSTTPHSNGGSPMSVDSPPTILSEDLPAELRHPLDRGPDDLYYRQVELIQARMTEQEREEDDQFRAKDFWHWKLCHSVIGRLTEHDDEKAWEEHCTQFRKTPWGFSEAAEEGLQSQKPAFMRHLKAKREQVQIADIEKRKKALHALDPTNIFLKAQQQEEEQAIDHDEAINTGRTFTCNDLPPVDDEDEDDEDAVATDPQQSVDDQAVNTPPPPPRPGNAQLPQASAPAGAGMAHLKYASKVPSKLRYVEEMSPLHKHQDKENEAPSLKSQFMEAMGQYVEDGRPIPGAYKEEYYYGEEDIVRELKNAYAMARGMGLEF